MGGEGSGIKGHTTPKEFVESKIKKVQSILEFAIGTDIVGEFDVPLEIRPIEFMEEFTPAMVEIDFEGKPKKIIISSEYAKPTKTHPLERMIGHELTHWLFSRLSQQSKGAGEGLAVLTSSFVDDKPTESIQYLVWAMGMAEVLEDITEERKIGIRELLKEYHDLDKMSINQRILNFSAQDKEQKLLGDLNKKHSDMVKEIVTGYEEGLVGEGRKVNLKILREDFELSVKKFFNLFRIDKTFSKGGKGSGVKGHTTYHEEMVKEGLKNLTPRLKERLKEIREGNDSEEQKEQFIEDVILLGIELSKKGKQKKERSEEQQEILGKIKQNKEERLTEKIENLQELSDGKVKEKEIRESLTKISESKNKEEIFQEEEKKLKKKVSKKKVSKWEKEFKRVAEDYAEEIFQEEEKKLKKKVSKKKVSKWEKEFKRVAEDYAEEIFQPSKEMERDIKKFFSKEFEKILKGGPGSGVKGHKRDMPDIKRLDTDFAGMEIQQVRRKLLNYYAPGEIRDMESKNGEKSLRARLQSAVTGKPVSFKKAAMASTLSGEPGYVPMPEVYDGMGKPIKTKKNEKKIFDLVAAMYKEIQEEIDEEWDRLFEE